MRTLHIYLLRQILASLALTVVVFTFVLLLANVLKEIVGLLVSGLASPILVAKAILLLIPFVLVFALPLGMLTSTILVFGRLSSDNELTAARASGISLISLASPILGLSLVLSAVCAWINMDVAPRCRLVYKDLLNSVVRQNANLGPAEGRFTRLGNHVIYVGHRSGASLEDIMIFEDKDGKKVRDIRAAKGELLTETNQFRLRLMEAQVLERGEHGWETRGSMGELEFPLRVEKTTRQSTQNIKHMSFVQLWEERQLWRQQLGALPNSPSSELRSTTPIDVQLHRQAAFSFAAIGFTLLGIPLGIRAHRRETNLGVAIALVLLAIYYSFFILGMALDTRPEFLPQFILWIPNFVFQALGATLLWRASSRAG